MDNAGNRPDGAGVFITFEGGEGAGKTTHIRFLAKALEGLGYSVLMLREPGGTELGEALRALVLDPAYGPVSPRCEMLIYEAARAQLVDEVIKPALVAGKIVLCDRFTDSTEAYQGFGRGIDREQVRTANAFAADGLVPHATLLLRCEGAAEGLVRATHHGSADRLEQAGLDFHQRVELGFGQMCRESDGRIRVIDTSGPKSHTAAQVFSALVDVVPALADSALFDEDYFSVLDVKAHG